LKTTISGIKCDNKACGYKDDSVGLEQYPKYVYRPCPKCGEKLLTEKGFNIVKAMLKLQKNPLMRAFEFICKLFGGKDVNFEFDLDGSGKVKIKDIKKVD
jgi:hypothetical protein